MQKFNSKKYWETRYNNGGNSGNGSYGNLAKFKAKIINDFIIDKKIKKIIELGCGDGNQLKLFKNYEEYVGVDVSSKVVDKLKKEMPKHQFILNDNFDVNNYKGNFDLTLSLDVIFHLVEDNIYDEYINNLVNLKSKYLIIYSCNFKDDGSYGEHVKPRLFSNNPSLILNYKLEKIIPNKYPSNDHKSGSFSDFYIYELL